MNNKKLFSIILRHSVILPIARIIILQVLICLGVAVLVVMAAYLKRRISIDIPIITTIIVLFIIDIMYCIVICLRWWFEYYIIKKTRVIHHKGVICESTQTHNCERIESITVEQDFWGRIMNHGDIRINEPPMQQEIIMYGIPEPKKNVDIVCDLLFEEESDKRFRTQFYRNMADEDVLRYRDRSVSKG